MPSERLLLALDYGGTKLTAAAATPDTAGREWRVRRSIPSPPGADARYDQFTMLALADEVLAGDRPAAVGVSFGGPVNAAAGLVLLSHHVRGWENTPLRAQLQSRFGAPCFMDNDANAAALGEWRFGAGQVEARPVASLLYVTVSTGVGGGWILDGRIHGGAEGMAGEIGHTMVDPAGPLCICGRRGCVESIASGPNLARRARERLMAEPEAGRVLRELVSGNLEAVTAERVARAAEAGDELAEAVLTGAARALGHGLGTAITLMNPQRVILGGGVTKAGERWWRAVRSAARANVLPGMTVDIVPAALGDDAPLWGAVALAMTGN
ncbi:MAG: ROK family protein [Chloroflexi bacterium]|nr:ROK family protein [Chloroflexota bacterium]